MTRFAGTIKQFAYVGVAKMVAWIKAVPVEDWPQQRAVDYQLRPAMVTDLLWHEFGNAAWPVVQSFGFDETNAYQLMLSAVMPGHSIPPHRDEQPESWKFRVHVPLLTNPGAVFVMDDGEHHLEIGNAYKMNTLRSHAVENRGKTPRIHFMFDVKG